MLVRFASPDVGVDTELVVPNFLTAIAQEAARNPVAVAL
jgi:hypothetical protein